MKVATFDDHGMYRGERFIEVQWIREKTMNVVKSKIVDAGCIQRRDNTRYVGTSKYCINSSNEIVSVDVQSGYTVYGEIYYVDIMDNESCNICRNADIVICVSVLEHIGLPVYNGKLKQDGDRVALANMISWMKNSGHLYLTIPLGKKDRMLTEWIRAYNPDTIRRMVSDAGGIPDLSMYAFINEQWMLIENDDEFMDSEPKPNITGMESVACVDITKKQVGS